MLGNIRFSMLHVLALGFFLAAGLPGAVVHAKDLGSFSQEGAVECPCVTLAHWRASSHDEKMSFLLGIVTMLEMERFWQGGKGLKVSQSLNGIWARGLSGVTLDQMRARVDQYAVEHPDQEDVSVVEVLARAYVQPRMTAAERRQADEHYSRLKKNK